MDRDALWSLNSGIGHYRRASQVSGLFASYSRSVENLLDAAGAQYSLRYCSPSRAGEHELKLVIRKGLQRARVSEVYSADGFGPGCVAW